MISGRTATILRMAASVADERAARLHPLDSQVARKLGDEPAEQECGCNDGGAGDELECKAAVPVGHGVPSCDDATRSRMRSMASGTAFATSADSPIPGAIVTGSQPTTSVRGSWPPSS